MQVTSALVLAAVVVVVLLVAIAYAWYNHTGWQPFAYKTGDSPAWVPTGQADVSRLRFKGCAFTVTRADGVTRTHDVTPALNSMAVAYRKGINNPLALTLTRPLNPFSFVIPGFNDRATVSDPTAAPWCARPPPACQSDASCPMPVPGACTAGPRGPSTGVCFSCAGGATATLAGEWRVI